MRVHFGGAVRTTKGLPGIRPDEDSPGLHHTLMNPQQAEDLKWVSSSWTKLWDPVNANWTPQGSTSNWE